MEEPRGAITHRGVCLSTEEGGAGGFDYSMSKRREKSTKTWWRALILDCRRTLKEVHNLLRNQGWHTGPEGGLPAAKKPVLRSI